MELDVFVYIPTVMSPEHVSKKLADGATSLLGVKCFIIAYINLKIVLFLMAPSRVFFFFASCTFRLLFVSALAAGSEHHHACHDLQAFTVSCCLARGRTACGFPA